MRRIDPAIIAECVRLRATQQMSVCELSRRFGLSTGTIYPWIKHLPKLERREHKAPSTVWTATENVTLAKLWAFAPKPEIMAKIPRHPSWIAIAKHASYLGLKRHPEANSRSTKKIDPLFVALRRAREAKNWTRQDLAHKLGYHPVQIARWELGDIVPPWRAVTVWAKALGKRIVLAGTDVIGEEIGGDI